MHERDPTNFGDEKLWFWHRVCQAIRCPPWLQCHEHQALAKALPRRVAWSARSSYLFPIWICCTIGGPSTPRSHIDVLSDWHVDGEAFAQKIGGKIVTSDTRKFETCLFSWSISSICAARTAPICSYLKWLAGRSDFLSPKAKMSRFSQLKQTKHHQKSSKNIKITPTSSKWTSIFSSFPHPKLKLFRLSRMFRPA